jgi:hypothetical protein
MRRCKFAARLMGLRRRGAVGLLVVAGALAFAVPAFAVDIVYHNGFLYQGQVVEGPRHSLTYIGARKLGASSTEICVVTADRDRVIDSASRCTAMQNGVAEHAFCGCKLRYPIVFARNDGGGTDTRARLRY